MRRHAILPVMLAVLAVAAATAFAYWSTSATGSASAATATLTAPSGVTVPSSSSGSVSVSWTAPAPPASGTVVYAVQRNDGTNGWIAAGGTCPASSAAGFTGTSCTDTVTPAGTYTYRVVAYWRTWTATSAASGSVTVNPMTRPTIGSAPANPSNSSTAGFSFSGGGSSTYACKLDSGAFAACTSPATYSGLSDGSHSFTVHATSGSLNGPDATYTWTIDTAAPAVTMAVPSSPTSNNKPAFSGTAGTASGDSSTVTVKVYSGSAIPTDRTAPVATLSATATGSSWSVAPTTALADGTYTAQASQSDTAGNTGTSAARTFTVDTAAPAVTMAVPSSPTSNNKPTFSGTAGMASGDSSAVTVKVYSGSAIPTDGTAPVATLSATATGSSWSVAPTTALADGTYTAQASQSDTAGNTGTSAARTFTVDTTGPTVASTLMKTTSTGALQGGIAGYFTNKTTYRILANITDATAVASGATVNAASITPGATALALSSCAPDCGTVGGVTYHFQTAVQTAFNSASDGQAYSYTVSASDTLGNATSAPGSATADLTAPTYSSIATSNGGTAGKIDKGDTVTVTFGGAGEVIDPNSLLPSWAWDWSTAANVVITIADGANKNDTIKVTDTVGNPLPFGAIDLGSGTWVSADAVFGGAGAAVPSTLTRLSATSFRLTLGSLTSGSTAGGQSAGTAISWKNSSAFDRAGLAPTGNGATSSTNSF